MGATTTWLNDSLNPLARKFASATATLSMRCASWFSTGATQATTFFGSRKSQCDPRKPSCKACTNRSDRAMENGAPLLAMALSTSETSLATVCCDPAGTRLNSS